MKPVIARFHPQAIVCGNAVDIDLRVLGDPQNTWDVTDEILAMSRDEALAIRDDDYGTDYLRYAGPDWVRNWTGPFRIEVEAEIKRFFSEVDK